MRKTIVYHTRLDGEDSRKIVGGTFEGDLNKETAESLVNTNFSVLIKPSGRPVFVDREKREVSLYIRVDPSDTEKGRVALRRHQERIAREEAEEDRTHEHADLLDELEDARLEIMETNQTVASALSKAINHVLGVSDV